MQDLTSYQGEVVQFPLTQALPLVKGEVVALTSPTWAPVLSIGLAQSFGYVQSRTGNCGGDPSLPAYYDPQNAVGQIAAYGCTYTKTRVEYTATETLTPTAAAAVRLSRLRDCRSQRRLNPRRRCPRSPRRSRAPAAHRR